MKKIYVLLSAVIFGVGAFAQGDNCANALPVTPGIHAADGPLSGNGSGNECYTLATNSDWYSFTPTCDGTITVSSDGGSNTGGNLDSRLSIYTGVCGALVCAANDDDGGVNPNYSSVVSNLAVVGGTTYLIEWDDRYGDGKQAFSWELTYVNATQFGNVGVSGITALQGGVAWDAFAGETDWNVEYGVQGFTPGSGTIVPVTGTTGLTITGLNAETTYDVIISDLNSACLMSIISFTTLPLCPTPIGVSHAAPGAVGTQVNWTAGGIETDWEVEYGPTGFALGNGTTDPVNGALMSTIAGLNQLTCYNYYVRASCLSVNAFSLWVGPIEFCTTASCPEPSNLSSTVISPDSVEINWTVGGVETGWEISYGLPGFVAGSGMSSVSMTNPDTLTGLTADTEYEYYVNSNCDADGISVWVGPMTFTTAISCAEVTALNIFNLTTTSVDLGWTAGGTEGSWNVEYGIDGFTQGAGMSSIETGNTVSISGLTAGTDYDFYVQAICGAGDNAQWVGPYSFMTVISCPKPTGLAAINISNTAANLLFQAGDSETEWNIEWGIPGFAVGTGEETGMVSGTTDNPYYATGLNPSSTYEFYVQASCGAGDLSTWAGPFTFSTLLTNNLVCNAIDIATDGAVNTYNNVGATENGEATEFGTIATWSNDAIIQVPVWFSFVAPTSGNVTVSTVNDVTAANNSRTEIAIFSAVDCNNFGTFTMLSSNGGNAGSVASACALTAGNTYYVMVDGFSDLGAWTPVNAFQGDFGISVEAVNAVEAGTAVTGSICTNETTDMFDAIEGYSHNDGTWYFPNATNPLQSFNSVNGTMLLNGISAGVDFTVDYVVSIGCAADTVSTVYNWSPQPTAGNDGTVTTCPNTEVLLIQELSGTVSFGGTWFDDDNAGGLVNGIVHPTNIVAGDYNFSYVVDNGTCSDTAIVVVTVEACLGVEANETSSLVVYPNPVANVLTISNLNVNGDATIVLTDVQGKVIYTNTVSNVNGNYELDLSSFENGIYIVEVTSELSTEKVRVVKH